MLSGQPVAEPTSSHAVSQLPAAPAISTQVSPTFALTQSLSLEHASVQNPELPQINALAATIPAAALNGLQNNPNIVDIEIAKKSVNFSVKTVSAQKLPVRGRGRCKASRDGYAHAAELADHFTERRVLPANGIDSVHAKLSELDDK